MLPRAVPLAAPPFACPNTLGRERRAGTSLRELHPRCLDVSLWRNRDASCRSGKDSLRSLLRRRRLEAQKTKLQPARSTISLPSEIERHISSSRGEFASATIWLLELSDEQFDSIHYIGMATYKIGILLLNRVPFIVLWIVG